MLTIWIAVALLAIALELFVTSFLVAPFAVGAIAAIGGVVVFPDALILQLLLFIAGSIIGFLMFYPLNRRLERRPSIRTNTHALIGKQAVSLSEITENGGQVKLSGEIWSAKSWVENENIANDQKVEVVSIQGATAIVRPI